MNRSMTQQHHFKHIINSNCLVNDFELVTNLSFYVSKHRVLGEKYPGKFIIKKFAVRFESCIHVKGNKHFDMVGTENVWNVFIKVSEICMLFTNVNVLCGLFKTIGEVWIFHEYLMDLKAKQNSNSSYLLPRSNNTTVI